MRIVDCIQWTEQWKNERAWVITGTKLEWVLWWPKAQLTQIYELIWEEFAPLEEIYKSPYMDRWNELEPIAKARYEELMNCKIKEVWFVKSEKYVDEYWEWFWVSPDWLIETNWKYTKAIEIKCPWSKNFVKYSIEWVIPSEYYKQVMAYFLVNEDLQELDFIIFHPDFYLTDKKLKVINIKRDDLKDDLLLADWKILEFRKLWIDNIKKLKLWK